MAAIINLSSPQTSVPFTVGARTGDAVLTSDATSSTVVWTTSDGLTITLKGGPTDLSVTAGDASGTANFLEIKRGTTVLATVTGITFDVDVHGLEAAWTTATWATALAGDDQITGTSGDNSLEGFDGNDVIVGRGGNDQLLGGVGNDRLRGGNGDDTLNGGADTDTADFSAIHRERTGQPRGRHGARPGPRHACRHGERHRLVARRPDHRLDRRQRSARRRRQRPHRRR